MRITLIAVALLAAAQLGCHNEPPPPRVPVPASAAANPWTTYGHDPVKPLPSQTTVAQAPPTTQSGNAFLDAYRKVGGPHIAVFVNHDEKLIDAPALEAAVLDSLSNEKQVYLVSPQLLREKLTAEQVQELSHGGTKVLPQLASQTDADVFVHVYAQAVDATHARLLAEAVNTRGAASLGKADVDFTPPLSSAQAQKLSPLLIGKLTDQMAATWNSPPAQ